MPRILIIEDDAAFCQMLQRFLAKKGYDVETSFTAEDAKKKFKGGDFDMVITDLRLPNYDGIELLSDIKAINSKIPVLVMTSYAEVSTAVTAMKKGAFDYISKPFTPEEMVMLVENALNQKVKQVETVAESNEKEAQDKITLNVGNGIKGISDASKKLH